MLGEHCTGAPLPDGDPELFQRRLRVILRIILAKAKTISEKTKISTEAKNKKEKSTSNPLLTMIVMIDRSMPSALPASAHLLPQLMAHLRDSACQALSVSMDGGVATYHLTSFGAGCAEVHRASVVIRGSMRMCVCLHSPWRA